jgi:cytochrome P450
MAVIDKRGSKGPIVRVTPWEIHIKDPGFLDEIYAPASRSREKYPFLMRTLKTSEASGATVKHETHRRRREALNPFFSKKAIAAFESVIRERVSKLCTIVENYNLSGTPINLSDAYFALAKE